MKTQRTQPIFLILVLALVASLCVSPVAGAQPNVAAGETQPNISSPARVAEMNAPPLQDIVFLSAGGYETCVVTSGGAVKCWGTPLPALIYGATPKDVPSLSSDIKAVSVSKGWACVLTNSGGVKCWGGDYGSTPKDIPGLNSGVKAVDTGAGHACALTDSGGVKCWGYNYAGQLGDGTTTDRTAPVNVVGLSSGVAAVTVGGDHTCALTSSGGVKCWGYNGNGRLGDGTATDRLTPVDVVGLSSGVIGITANNHTCAITSGGGVKCWGPNGNGELGDGTTIDKRTPADVFGLSSGVVALALGDNLYDLPHTCALTNTNAVKCWGFGGLGELGNDATMNHSTPVDVVGLSGEITSLAAGTFHTCALTGSGGVKCWGYNGYGQLGKGAKFWRTLAADVSGLTGGLAALVAGHNHTCALTSSGGVKCWGAGSYGQLGNGATSSFGPPVDVCAGGASSCTTALSSVKALAAGLTHTCAVTDEGGVKCWGTNEAGELGNGELGGSSLPVDVFGLNSGIATVDAGVSHTCAVTSSGGVKCWGWNEFGQLGDGASGNLQRKPVDVVGLTSGVAGVALGWGHTCALTTGGGVKCWGIGGALGDGTTTASTVPVNVVGLASGVAAIAAGQNHTCALTSAGGLKCWGANDFGEVGDGTRGNPRLTPVDVVGLSSGVTAVTATANHTCALTSTGGVKCWGVNDGSNLLDVSGTGQLGDGTTTNRNAPVDVIGLSSGVTAVAAGSAHTCALVGAGRPKCWGVELQDQPDTTMYSSIPVDVLAAAQPPRLSLNYTTGAPGSSLTLNGFGFPGVYPIALKMNGANLGSTSIISESGEFLIHLNTAAADEGFYSISAASSPGVIANFILSGAYPTRLQEGGGLTTLSVPAGIAAPNIPLYMPLMLRKP